MMSTSSSVASVSSEEEFIPPPPPPPRILLLRGKCLNHVFSFLDAADKSIAVASCRLFRDALYALDDESRESSIPQIERVSSPVDGEKVEPPRKRPWSKLTIAAPPGRLGIRLENTPTRRGTVVALILEASPLQGKICAGDMIVGVNGVDVSGLDTYGTLEVFQKFMNDERFITFLCPGAASENVVIKVDETPPTIDATCATSERTAQHEICTPIVSAPAQKSRDNRNCTNAITNDEVDTTVTGIDSIQTKSILRTTTNDETATITPLFSLPYPRASHLQVTPFGGPVTIPSSDSDLQLESLDLNSLNSCKSDKDSSNKQLLPRVREQRPTEVIPFDELEVGGIKLPDFPSSTDSGYFVPCTQTSTVSEVDDDDLTMSSSAGSTYVSSLSPDHPDFDYDEEKADYLAQFADAALFGDTTLFTSFVKEIIDSAKDAARLVTEKGDPIDDQGPIKIGDNYYTHREAIQKWKSARDKLKNSKYKHDQAKLQQKLEHAAMEAATLMAATKTFDLAARRSGRNMEKKEQKSASRKFSGTDGSERVELKTIHSQEKEKDGVFDKDKNDMPALTIHQLVNRFQLFGFPNLNGGGKAIQGEPLDKQAERVHSKTPVKSRFTFLVEPSDQCSGELSNDVQKQHLTKDLSIEKEVKESQFQYLTACSYEEEATYDVGIELGSSDEVMENDVVVLSEGHAQPSETDNKELEVEIIEQLKLNAARRASSPSVSVRSRSFTNLSPSTPVSYSSEITELAGCSGRNKIGRSLSVALNESDCSSHSGSDVSDVEDLGFIINDANIEQSLVNGVNISSSTSSTDGSSVETSEESSEVLSHGVENESFFSGKYPDKLGRTGCLGTITENVDSALQSSALGVLPKSKKAKQGNSQSSTDVVDDDAQVVDEMSGVLRSTAAREESECLSDSGRISKVTYDSLIGSQYGTEVILSVTSVDEQVSNHPQLPRETLKEPLRLVTARKPRTLSNHNMGIVTPSPTKETIKLRRSGVQSRESYRSSPLRKRMNPLKLIKAPSYKKQSKPSDVNSQAGEEHGGPTYTSIQVPGKGDKCPKGSLPLKMSFGVARSRSAGP